ncbi:MAG: DUF4105 domain-containing protein [Comamonadaceae bacterium]|nr:DUF4105 domain-containing protein [Comamonadaceae bacterium]
MVRLASLAGLMVLALLIAATGGWAALMLSVSGPGGDSARTALAGVAGMVTLVVIATLILNRWRLAAVSLWLLVLAGALAWWFAMKPSNDRDWLPNVARTPWATVEGDIVTLHNVRNFSYRTETDFTPAWYDKSYDLRKLEGIDIVASYWMGPDIAHVFVSFAFAGGDHLAMSIETRTEKGEGYSAIKGFFRQYELYYVVADERDVIGLRTNFRRDPPEDVYVYRVKSNPEGRRAFFLEYVRQINALKDHPEFYNSLTTNCTTNIWTNSHVNPGHLPLSWKILASGHVPEYLFENGRLEDPGLTFADIQRRAHINARAKAAGIVPDFSQRIRKPE